MSNMLTCYVTCPSISYAEVRSPGFLHFYKDKKAADQNRFNDPSRNSDPQITIVDLRSVVDFAVPEKKNKDNLELELVTATESIRLKLVNSAFFIFISSILMAVGSDQLRMLKNGRKVWRNGKILTWTTVC
jgi:hypothetical protein